jgi:hypothetical protein
VGRAPLPQRLSTSPSFLPRRIVILLPSHRTLIFRRKSSTPTIAYLIVVARPRADTKNTIAVASRHPHNSSCLSRRSDASAGFFSSTLGYDINKSSMAPTSRRSAAKAAEKAEQEVIADTIVAPAAALVAATEHPIEPNAQPGPLVPEAAQFPLAAALSFAAASMGYSLLNEFTNHQLAAVTRTQDTWGELAALSGWRLFELALGWYGHLDSVDVAMMDLLSHGPTLYLLSTFYNLSPGVALGALAVNTVSAAVPFYLFRPTNDLHRASPAVPNRELVDVPLQLYTTALSCGIYSVTLVLALRFLLPKILILYFARIPSLEPAYEASYAAALPVTLLFGAAASVFIFAPFATAAKSKDDDKIAEFDPATATLDETLWWNLWGFTAKSKVVIRRTAVVMLLTGVNTFLSCTMGIYGVEPQGAAAYAAVWVVAALFTGYGLAKVGSD